MNASEGAPPAALVVAADEQMRILLRGLLQLHRVRVDAEAEGLTEALRLLREHRPTIVVADTHLSDGTPPELVRAARSAQPGLRVILVAPASRPPPAAPPDGAPDVVLLRPFRIQQFAEAVQPRGLSPPSG